MEVSGCSKTSENGQAYISQEGNSSGPSRKKKKKEPEFKVIC